MFSGNGAELLCSRQDVATGYALINGAGSNLAPVSQPSTSARTITGRDIGVPTEDPYSPVANARVPVPGYTAWPPRRNVLRRRYYGLNGIGRGSSGDKLTAKVMTALKAKPKGFAGLGGWEDFDPGFPGSPVPVPNSGGGSRIDWERIISQGINATPAIIQTARGRNTPTGFYDPVAVVPPIARVGAVLPVGYHYNASGELVKDAFSNVTDFVSENPILVAGAALLVVVLFLKPPGRR